MLKAKFDSRPIEVTEFTPTVIRSFVLGDVNWSPSTIRVMGDAVRSYFRYRKLQGDDVAHLLRAVPRPACWRDSTLPIGLSPDELEQLFGEIVQGTDQSPQQLADKYQQQLDALK